MIKPQIPENENERLENLKSYAILDTLPEKEYDEITFLASQICGTPISLISFIDEDRQWFKSNHGLHATETHREYAFCAHAINDQNDIFVVPDSRIDERFHDNPLVRDVPNVIFYAGIPLVSQKGFALGTLCVIDNVPHKLDEVQIKSLKALANQLIKLMELRISLNEIEKSRQQLKELNITKDKLFSIIAHDLRSPFNSILGFSELLIDEIQKENYTKVKPYVSIIRDGLQRVYNLSNNLLIWVTNEMNGIKFTPDNFELESLAKESIDNLRIQAEVKSIEIIHSISCESTVYVDKDILTTVLRNLISNAIKFTPQGGKIFLSISSNDEYVQFSVKDNGIGISSQNIKKLFKIDEVNSTSGTNNEKGTGLGLIICKDMVLRHQGEIWAESEEGKGSTFHFKIPVKHQE